MATKFICDGMLGKLCKHLRVCGIDTLYSNQGIAILLEARKQNRIVITRNTHLRGKDSIFFIQTSNPVTQLKMVITQYNLQNRIQPFSRCIECNYKLKSVSKESVRDKVPYFTYKNFNEFALCLQCQRVYWKGSHYKNMIKDIKYLIANCKFQIADCE
jgi:uncharacterized protein with PIN domain